MAEGIAKDGTEVGIGRRLASWTRTPINDSTLIAAHTPVQPSAWCWTQKG